MVYVVSAGLLESLAVGATAVAEEFVVDVVEKVVVEVAVRFVAGVVAQAAVEVVEDAAVAPAALVAFGFVAVAETAALFSFASAVGYF